MARSHWRFGLNLESSFSKPAIALSFDASRWLLRSREPSRSVDVRGTAGTPFPKGSFQDTPMRISQRCFPQSLVCSDSLRLRFTTANVLFLRRLGSQIRAFARSRSVLLSGATSARRNLLAIPRKWRYVDPKCAVRLGKFAQTDVLADRSIAAGTPLGKLKTADAKVSGLKPQWQRQDACPGMRFANNLPTRHLSRAESGRAKHGRLVAEGSLSVAASDEVSHHDQQFDARFDRLHSTESHAVA